MDSETFTLRKKFLEEFYKDRVKLTNSKITISQDGFTDLSLIDYMDGLSFKTCVKLDAIDDLNIDDLNIDIKDVHRLIKPLIYYLYSITYKTKFLREKLLLYTERIIINYKFHVDYVTTKVNTDIHTDCYNYDSLGDFSFLECYNEKELSESHAVNSVDNTHLYYLEIVLNTYYVFDNYEDYITLIGELEENGEIVVNSQPRDSENKEEKIINSSQTFKSNECVICLTNSPNILFCNCGHIPICIECDKIKTLSSCPVCKTENTILRLIE